ncbi:MAG: hypothetical protein P8X63_08435 [Desulfuromonadaceae bacterium]
MKRIAVLLALATLLLSGCAGTKLVRTEVDKQHEFNVTLEQVQNEGAVVSQGYAHPYEVDLADLKKLLGDLSYLEETGIVTKEQEKGEAFQAGEVNRLAPALKTALAKANANQRVHFISYNLNKQLLFSNSRKTEGILFVDANKRLNLAFNFVNQDRRPNETSAMLPIFSELDPLTISASKTPLTALPPYAQQQQLTGGAKAPLWISVDMNQLQQAIVKEEAALPKLTDAALRDDIKTKLKYLKELLEEDLITEKNYNRKKMELLDKIQ